MKKNHYFTVLGVISLLITSCGGGSKEVIVKNNSKDFIGDLKGYIEVVDGNYTLAKPSVDLLLTVKLRVIKPLEGEKEFGEIRAELLDETGMPLTGLNNFVLAKEGWVTTESDNLKIDNALKDGQGDVAVQFVYDTYDGGGSVNRTDALKMASKKAKSFSIISSKLKEESATSSSTSTSAPSSDNNETVSSAKSVGNENWNSILDSYEKYVNQYIALLKKANAGDMSAMTEYASMMEKATEFADKLENASDDLTEAQTARFLKLQTKLTNAAAGL